MSTRALTSEQLRSYEENGFLIVEDLVTRQDCTAIIDHFMDVQLERKRVPWHTPRDPDSPPRDYWRRYFNTHRQDELSMRYMKLPQARDVLADLMDAEPVGVQSMFFFKAPDTPGQSAHQDTNYIGSEPESLTACWIALDDANEENGTMWVVPGSNRGPLHERGETHDTEEYEDWTDELVGADAMDDVPVVVPAGAGVFFHGRLIHRFSHSGAFLRLWAKLTMSPS